MASLKIGYISIPFVLQVDSDGSQDGVCYFKQNHFGRIFNDFLHGLGHLLRPLDLNCTAYKFDNVGYLGSNGNYSGLIGGLQRHEYDFSFLPFYYPLVDKNGEFEYSPPVHEDQMTIFSMYNMTDMSVSQTQDVIFMFSSISYYLRLGLFFTFCVLVSLLHHSYKYLRPRNRPSAWYMVFRAYLNDDNFSNDSLFYTVFAFFVSIGLFFAMCYTCNSVSTDLVVIPDPQTIRTYEEIIDKSRAAFTEMAPEYSKFVLAPEKSIQHRLTINDFKYEPGMDFFRLDRDKIIQQKICLIGRQMVSEGFGLEFLQTMKEETVYNKTRGLISVDEKAMKYTNIFVWNSKTHENIKVSITKLVTHLYEAGTIAYTFDNAALAVSTAMFGNVEPSLLRKISKTIQRSSVEYETIGLSKTTYVFITFLILIICCIPFLLYEMIHHKLSKRKKLSKPNPPICRSIRQVQSARPLRSVNSYSKSVQITNDVK